jgi:hypothetical protein
MVKEFTFVWSPSLALTPLIYPSIKVVSQVLFQAYSIEAIVHFLVLFE